MTNYDDDDDDGDGTGTGTGTDSGSVGLGVGGSVGENGNVTATATDTATKTTTTTSIKTTATATATDVEPETSIPEAAANNKTSSLVISPSSSLLLPSASASTSSVSVSLLPDQDMAVYGSLNKELNDALAEKIEVVIKNGVDSLPLLDDDCYRATRTCSTENNTNNNNNRDDKDDGTRISRTTTDNNKPFDENDDENEIDGDGGKQQQQQQPETSIPEAAPTNKTSSLVISSTSSSLLPSMSASSVSVSLLSDQDMAVYGTLNKELNDALAEQIEVAIKNGVDSLPLLDDDCYRATRTFSTENNNINNNKNKDDKDDGTPRSITDNHKPFDENDDENEIDGVGGKHVQQQQQQDHETQQKNQDQHQHQNQNTKTPKQNLVETLTYKFVRNVDVVESYCAHHVMTLRKHPPARRKRIVAVLKNGVQQTLDVLEIPVSNNDNNDDTGIDTDRSKSYPTQQSEIPTTEEVNQVIEDIAQLKLRLEEVRKERNELLALEESTNRAEQYISAVTSKVTAQNQLRHCEEGMVHKNVSTFVANGNTARRLAEETKDMITKLDTLKRDRSNKNTTNNDTDTTVNDEERFDFDFTQQQQQQQQQDIDPLGAAEGSPNKKRSKRRPPLSMHELYVRDRQQLGLVHDSTNDELTTMKDHVLVGRSSQQQQQQQQNIGTDTDTTSNSNSNSNSNNSTNNNSFSTPTTNKNRNG